MPKRLLTITLLCLLITGQTTTADNESSIAREIKVGVYHNPPLIFSDSTGKAKGIFIDILEYIAVEKNWKLNYFNYTLEEALIATQNNLIDIAPCIAYSKEREKTLRYSKDPIFINWGVIYTGLGNTIRDISEMEDVKLGIEKGDIHGAAFIKLLKDFNIHAKIFYYPDQKQLVEAIKKEEVEAIAINKVFGFNVNLKKELRETPILFNPVHLNFATSRESIELMNEVDTEISRFLTQSPEVYHSIIDRWMLAPIEKEKPLWLKVFLFIIGSIISLLVVYLIFLRVRITNNNRALKKELKLRTANEKLIAQLVNEKELILNSIDEQVVFVDPAYRVLWANKAYKEKTIKTFDNQLGQKCYEIVYGYKKPCEFCQIEKSKITHNTEALEYFDEQNQKYYRTKTSPVYDGGTSPIGFVKVISDFTDKKKNEEELIAAKEKAEESDFMKSTFLANMSHEIRTPMNAIIGFSELLEDNDLTNAQKNNYLNIIQSNGQHLLQLISDILIFSQLESGHIELQYSSFNIVEVLKETYQQFKSEKEKLDKPDLEIFLSIDKIESNTSLHSDNIRLKQIIFNLMTNALKFTEKGSITLGAHIKDRMLVIYVKDTGIGIPKDQQAKIFHRFLQVENPHLKKAEGTGLGLTISSDLIELLGGKIEVKSKVDVGSTFTIYHPIYQEESYNSVKQKQKTGIQ
nr:ATP-binding protein [uncultured Carboxylicivirga sp.]